MSSAPQKALAVALVLTALALSYLVWSSISSITETTQIQIHYSAQLRALAPLLDWTSQMTGFWQSRFDRLEDLLKRMDQ